MNLPSGVCFSSKKVIPSAWKAYESVPSMSVRIFMLNCPHGDPEAFVGYAAYRQEECLRARWMP